MKNWQRTLLVILSYAAVGGLIYSNVLTHGVFVMDDHDYVLHNPSVKNLGMMARDIWELRYFGYLTLALDYARAGFNPIPYHVTNVVIHLINAMLAFFLARRLWAVAGRGSPPWAEAGSFGLPFFVGLLFLVHPIQTTAASYISQRFTSQASLCYLGACLAYLGCRSLQEDDRSPVLRRILYAVSVLATLVGMKTKETSFTIPAMLLLTEVVFFGASRFGRRRFALALPHVAIAAIIPLSIFAQELGLLDRQGHMSWMLMAKKDDLLHLSRYVYFINQLRIVTMYLGLLILPVGQRAQYDFKATGDWYHPGVLWGAFVLSAFAIAGVVWYFKSRWAAEAEATASTETGPEGEAGAPAVPPAKRSRLFSLASFGVGWFFIAISVESSFIPIKHIVFEHRVYLPAFGFFLVAASLGTVLFRRLPEARRRNAMIAACAVAVAALGATTYYRNRIWVNAVLLWTDVVEKSPNMLAGWHNRAVEYRLKGRLDLAMRDMDRAVDHVKKKPYKGMPWPDPDLNPENASKVRGMRAKVALAIGDFGKAREDFRATIDLFDQATNKEFVLTVLMDIANGFLDAKLYPDAIDAFSLLQQRVPNDPNVYMSRGKAFLQANFFQEALADFDRMLSMNPNDGSAYFYRSMALGGLGQADRARADLSRACDLGFTAACNQIGRPTPVPGPR